MLLEILFNNIYLIIFQSLHLSIYFKWFISLPYLCRQHKLVSSTRSTNASIAHRNSGDVTSASVVNISRWPGVHRPYSSREGAGSVGVTHPAALPSRPAPLARPASSSFAPAIMAASGNAARFSTSGTRIADVNDNRASGSKRAGIVTHTAAEPLNGHDGPPSAKRHAAAPAFAPAPTVAAGKWSRFVDDGDDDDGTGDGDDGTSDTDDTRDGIKQVSALSKTASGSGLSFALVHASTSGDALTVSSGGRVVYMPMP